MYLSPQTPPRGRRPQTLHDLQMDKGLAPPPNSSRLANGQGLAAPQPFTTCKRTRVAPSPPTSRIANGQGLPPHPAQPFTTCKYGLPSPPPKPFATCKWTRVAPPQPFTTCKWTRVGGPATLHDLGAASE